MFYQVWKREGGTNEMSEHTRLPWRVFGGRVGHDSQGFAILHGNEDTHSPIIADCYSDNGYLPAEANAHFIVRAVNSYDERENCLRVVRTDIDALMGDQVPLTEMYGFLNRVVRMIDGVLAESEAV